MMYRDGVRRRDDEIVDEELTFSPVGMWTASFTLPKVPSPMVLPSMYWPTTLCFSCMVFRDPFGALVAPRLDGRAFTLPLVDI